jgi:hypothetical protein
MRKLIAALLVAILLVTVFVMAVDAQSTFQRFENVVVKSLRSLGAVIITGNTSVAGTFAATGASTLTGDVTTGGATTVGTYLAATLATTQTVVADGTIAPAGTYQPITAAGAVGTSSVTILPTGTLLYLVNVGSNAITLTDTGTLVLGGNMVLGAGDTGLLVSNGVNWYQVGTANN